MFCLFWKNQKYKNLYSGKHFPIIWKDSKNRVERLAKAGK